MILGFVNNTSFLAKFVGLIVIMSNLSQMPIFVESSMTQFMSMPVWVLLVIYCLITRKKFNISNIRSAVSLSVVFYFILLIMGAVDVAYFRSSLPLVMMISMFVLIVGTCVGPHLSDHDMNTIYACYIISAVVVGVSVYQSSIAGQSLEGQTYLYDSKNSLCQILLTAWCLILFTKLNVRSIVLRSVYILLLLFLTYEIFVLKSRASMIGIPIILFVAIVRGKGVPFIRKFSLLFILVSVVLLFNDVFFEFFRDNILYGGRDASDVSELSSGRSDEWAVFGDEFLENPVFGVGRCKKESIILTALLEFGLIGGVPLLLLAIQPLVYAKKKYKFLKSNTHFLILVSLAITYCINGVFEQLAPFGPGVKCYFLWFMYGIISSSNFQNQIITRNVKCSK